MLGMDAGEGRTPGADLVEKESAVLEGLRGGIGERGG